MISTVHTPLPIFAETAPKIWPHFCAPSPESETISTVCSGNRMVERVGAADASSANTLVDEAMCGSLPQSEFSAMAYGYGRGARGSVRMRPSDCKGIAEAPCRERWNGGRVEQWNGGAVERWSGG